MKLSRDLDKHHRSFWMFKKTFPSAFLNWRAVVTDTQVAATAPITIPPTDRFTKSLSLLVYKNSTALSSIVTFEEGSAYQSRLRGSIRRWREHQRTSHLERPGQSLRELKVPTTNESPYSDWSINRHGYRWWFRHPRSRLHALLPNQRDPTTRDPSCGSVLKKAV